MLDIIMIFMIIISVASVIIMIGVLFCAIADSFGIGRGTDDYNKGDYGEGGGE